jgi:hypothetical protein
MTYTTAKSKVANTKTKAKLFGKMAIGAGTSVGSSIGGAMLGQVLIPVPILGAFIGGVIGGIFGGASSSIMLSQWDKYKFKDLSK